MLCVALKEWSIVCDLLLSGEQVILLRKGGISEAGGAGRFAVEHDRFALFPAWEHQHRNRVKPAYRDRVRVFDREPETVELRAVGAVAGIWRVTSRAAFDSLDDLHCWARPQIDMRFNYKPDRPLFLLAVRVSRLASPKTIAVSPDYAGCRSWVPLSPADAVDEAGAEPVLDDAAFREVRDRIASALAST